LKVDAFVLLRTPGIICRSGRNAGKLAQIKAHESSMMDHITT
jgi:hypothetical protein